MTLAQSGGRERQLSLQQKANFLHHIPENTYVLESGETFRGIIPVKALRNFSLPSFYCQATGSPMRAESSFKKMFLARDG
jgi:hypothetical protein